MDSLESTLRVLVVVFMVGSLGGVGLGLAVGNAIAPLKHARFVLLALLLSWVVCPAVGWALLQLIALDRPFAVGLLLLALAPCAPFAPAMVHAARGDPAYLAAFMLMSAAGTVVILPLGIRLLFGAGAVDPMAIATPLLLFVLLPLAGGMAARACSESLAAAARPLVSLVTNLAGLAILLLVIFIHGRGVMDAVGSFAIVTQVLFISVITLVAHIAGAGLRQEQRHVLTLGTCTRNLGAALAPLGVIEPDPRGVVMIAIAAPVTLVVSAFTARHLARRSQNAAPQRTADMKHSTPA